VTTAAWPERHVTVASEKPAAINDAVCQRAGGENSSAG